MSGFDFGQERHTDPQAPVQDSPTIGRTQLLYSPSSNSSQSPSSDAGSYRSQRKAAPSPLQTSTSATSPPHSPTVKRLVGFNPPQESTAHKTEVLYYSPPNNEQPRSPKERLDDLLASERSFYQPDETPSEKSSSESQRTVHPSNVPGAAVRSVSEPLVVAKGSSGSTNTRQNHMAATAPPHRAEMARGPPRTSSIDSAISSISVGTYSQKASQDTQRQGAGSPDIANLIQAAGSPENVIQYLLKEKQSQSAQNSQLWRLVDKQRAMILGLNKDLERALKDKERYRKKVKETLAQGPPNFSQSTTNTARGDSSPESSTVSRKDSSVERLVSAGLRDPTAHDDGQASPIDVALAPYPITPPADYIEHPTPALVNMTEAEHKMPNPSAHAFQQYDSEAAAHGFENGQQQRKIAEVARDMPYNASVPPSRSLPVDPPGRNLLLKTSAMQVPSLAVIEASPNGDLGLKTFPTPPRKAPPAPLKLNSPIHTSSHLHQADSADEADSDYDDLLEVDEIPISNDRGRRKTREDDDRQREMAAQKDAELRSLSKKSKSRPTSANDKKEKKENPELEPLPPIKHAVQISPPADGSKRLSPPDSLAGSLAGMMTIGSDSISSRTISPPLMSPGLPLSPRPMDRGFSSPLPRNPREGSSSLASPLVSPPMSPRGIAAFQNAVPLSPRAPRMPIPLPPNTPLSLASPGLPRGQMDLVSPKPLHVFKKTAAPTNDSPPSTASNRKDSLSESSNIFRGFVTEEYPDLLFPPNVLPSIIVRVASSRLKPSRQSLMFPMKDEDPVFTLAVFSRSNGRELWRVEKDSVSLWHLDQQLRSSPAFKAGLPEKSLFSGHAPAKIDARRTALDNYLDEVMNTELESTSALALCRYLSTNTMEPDAEEARGSGDSVGSSTLGGGGPGGRPLRTGYLTKRGKNFGGWKARYFVLDGPVFKYYEAPSGAHLGAIKLQNAQIGKQQQQPAQANGDADDVDNQYRHAFLILEPKRKDSSSLVRHVLCAESDKERDQWVESLLQYVDFKDEEDEEVAPPIHARKGSNDSSHVSSMKSKKKAHSSSRQLQTIEPETEFRGVSYDSTSQGNLPHGASARPGTSDTPSPPIQGHERDHTNQGGAAKGISAPKNAIVISDSGSWGNKPALLNPVQDDKVKQKKRSFFGFGSSKPRISVETEHGNDSTSNLTQMAVDQHGPVRAAFGAPLAEAVKYNHPVDVDVELPAVVYRCIEYLDSKNAIAEEGIFRLSGSSVIIKQLRERFNVEGDVNLITDDQYYDIHAVASLLKLYLRELPTTILTRELYLDFIAVTELSELQEKIAALNTLVNKLPRANGALLRYLSGFLINIIDHADVNKMTVRNVGIVFSPTLNIPAPVFALFLQQYDGIFGAEDSDRASVAITISAPPLTPDDIRSPRRQHFQELPTPSYDQQSFPRAPTGLPHPSQHNRAIYDTGFTPLQPTYEAPAGYTMGGPEYGSRASTMAGPAYDQYGSSNGQQRRNNGDQSNGSSKAKRRESSMFGLGNKKPSFQKLKDDSRLVDEESFFE